MNQSVLKMLLTGIVLLAVFPARSSDFTVDGIWYEIISDEFGTVAVTDIDLQGGECVIPEKAYYRGKNYKVVAIDELSECNVDTLIMSNSIVDIAACAFKYSDIKCVVFSNQIKAIPQESFYSCGSLQGVALPDGLRYIGSRAFYGCKSLQNVDLPDGLRYIGFSAFYGCESLQNVDLPDGLRYIGFSAFSGCESLQGVDLPDDLPCIEDRTFSGCASLQSVALPDGLKYMGEYAFSGCASLQSVALPDGLRCIERCTFNGCESLQNVDLPDDFVYINGGYFFSMFSDCTSLRSVTLSTGAVGGYIFRGCASLQSVKFRTSSRKSGVNSKKRSLNRIADDMFSGCEAIESIEIPEGILEIGESAFEDCNQLSEVSLPDGLVSIGKRAFCENRLKEVVFPKSMLYIGEYSFQNSDMISYISEVVSLNPEPPYCEGLNYDICTHAVLSVPAGSKQKYLSHSSDWHMFSTINEIGQPGAVENIKTTDGIKVSAQDGAIYIDGIEGECPVYVYDLSGRLVEYGISSEILHVDSAGMYLVRVMGETYKVFVGK